MCFEHPKKYSKIAKAVKDRNKIIKMKRKYTFGGKYRSKECGDSMLLLFLRIAHSKVSPIPWIKAITLGSTPLNPSPIK